MTLSDNKLWDYIIIGGGSAGCVLANRLSEDSDIQVLLLDAGRNDHHPYARLPVGMMPSFMRKDMNWLYSAEPDPSRANRVDIWPAGKIIGGGSAINGMMYVRGHKSDYDSWAEQGNQGWSYKDVLPYFNKSETSEFGDSVSRGKNGPQYVSKVRVQHPLNQAFIDSAVEVGIPYNPDLNGDSQEGVGECQATQKRGWRYSTARGYLKPAMKRPNLTVRLEALVSKVQIENGRVTGVEYQIEGKKYFARSNIGVVISAGALASPKILMLSGVGPTDELKKHGIEVLSNVPGVGKNLQEHPVVRMSFHVKNSRTLTSDLKNPWHSLMHGLNYIFNGRGALANCIGHVQALSHTRPNLKAPNVQIIFSPLSYVMTETGPKPYTKPAVGVGIGLARIQSVGEVRLRSDKAEDNPVIDYSLLSNPDDVAQLREAMRLTRKIFSAKAFSEYYLDEREPGINWDSDEELNQYIRETSGLMFHPCGTCKMGADDMAVVSSDLAVKGVEGLWVADASVFPHVPAGNINATCIMVGEKAADLIKSKRRKND